MSLEPVLPRRPARERRTYRPPVTLSRERLEVLAVVCSFPGKTDPLLCSIGQLMS